MAPDNSAPFSGYLSLRSALIDEDRSSRREFLSSNVNLRTDKEIEADGIVRRIRALEAETIWRQDYPSVPHPFPGMEFLTGQASFVFGVIVKLRPSCLQVKASLRKRNSSRY